MPEKFATAISFIGIPLLWIGKLLLARRVFFLIMKTYRLFTDHIVGMCILLFMAGDIVGLALILTGWVEIDDSDAI